MLWFYAPALLMLLQSTCCFPRGKVTEKPEIPLMVNPKQRRPTHISEFTDPDTGLNPFLDLEEGRTSMGRNVMEDERRDDEPYFDIDLVEGDAPDRKWSFEEPKEHLGRAPPARWPEMDYKDESELPVLTTASVPPNPPTTVKLFIPKELDDVKSDVIEEEIEEIQQKVEKESFVVSQSTVIYASATVAVMTIVILLVGACWWRRKLKTSRSTTTVESGEVKS